MNTVNLAFLGFGNVGRALARLLMAKRENLSRQHGIEYRVVGIATRNHGAAIDQRGIDLERALGAYEAGESLSPMSASSESGDGVAFIVACGADLLFENTPVNYQSGQPAVDHIRAALEAGMHAITANKGPVVHAHRELAALASRRGRRFLFEAAVMDGAPIFSLWREALPGATLRGFRGILNSTTNLILTLMEEGKGYDESVAHAQAIGIAETDPSGDTLGWDAAIKVAALVTVLMETPLKPDQVDREGIENITAEQTIQAVGEGKRWKLVCTAERQAEGVLASVRPELLSPGDPLYDVMGTSSAVTFFTDVLGPLTIIENDPGPETTAYGLLADMIVALRQASGTDG